MFWLQRFQKKFPVLFIFCDRCLVFFVLLPALVVFWAALWGLIDYLAVNYDKEVVLWEYTGAGIFILTILNFVQYDLTTHFLQPYSSLRNIIIKRIYTVVAVCGNLLLWKGVWLAQEHYTGFGLGSALFSLIFGTVLLVCLRSSCNGIAAPLGTAFDEHHLFFIVPTRFQVKNDKKFLFFLDCLFSVAIVGSLVVFEWRGIWAVLDLIIVPAYPKLGIMISLILGYTICILVDLSQNQAAQFSAYLDRRKQWWLRLIFEDTFLFIAKCGVLAAWRGLWIASDMFLTRPGDKLDIQTIIILCAGTYALATILLHANSLFILEVCIDGGMADGLGCKVKVSILEHFIEFWGVKQKTLNLDNSKKNEEVEMVTKVDKSHLDDTGRSENSSFI